MTETAPPHPAPPNDLQVAEIEWSENGQPQSSIFNDVYFSSASGIDESRYVFIDQNDLIERWQAQDLPHFTIAETGFGTGLNFLCAAHQWLQLNTDKPSARTLHYLAAEKYPLTKTDLVRALALWPELANLSLELVEQYPIAVPGIHQLSMAKGQIRLTLLYGDASEMFAAIKQSDHPLFARQGNTRVNAWFLDGFAPAKNPEMWTDDLFQHIADLSGQHATFSTFTAAGIVKRGLATVGFSVSKVPGFGHKRDMLRGEMLSLPLATASISTRPAAVNSPYLPPWYLNIQNTERATPCSAIIIGGGIAGCCTARSLAERGLRVTLIERHTRLAQEASGNPQGILYPKLSSKSSVLARFGLASLLFSSRYHRHWLHPSGVLVLPESPADIEHFPKIDQRYPDDLVQLKTSGALVDIAGVALASDCGLFFPGLGWIHPPDTCRTLTEHPNIQVIQADIDRLEQNKQQRWLAEDSSGATAAIADIAVIACGNGSRHFAQTSHLPLKPIRGQISTLPETSASRSLKTVICGRGYLAPAIEGNHTLGATYNVGETGTALSETDHRTNLQHLQDTDSALPELFGSPDIASLAGRVGFRCTTPDYLPVAGPAPDYQQYRQDYALLRKNARAHIPVAGKHWPGLYLNCGHGSRGMSYAPLCAELIASQICNEIPPLELDLRQAIHPGRFIIRDMKRNKI